MAIPEEIRPFINKVKADPDSGMAMAELRSAVSRHHPLMQANKYKEVYKKRTREGVVMCIIRDYLQERRRPCDLKAEKKGNAKMSAAKKAAALQREQTEGFMPEDPKEADRVEGEAIDETIDNTFTVEKYFKEHFPVGFAWIIFLVSAGSYFHGPDKPMTKQEAAEQEGKNQLLLAEHLHHRERRDSYRGDEQVRSAA
jgi:hypothetical protein